MRVQARAAEENDLGPRSNGSPKNCPVGLNAKGDRLEPLCWPGEGKARTAVVTILALLKEIGGMFGKKDQP